ncbi:hypothetical protein QP027_04175 [Corynebacterium breve]|uniref:Uncharacterized protein n=1 Tax=Corynebacterium breve TaxID=3049799 RepID=A0ABY8VHQ4_9CORY|nr:hypothetical protein [Corynebacterium breve]WIM68597.1 hypothetical protein QP027_04175 [Corynebacterium breve]
MPTDQLFVMFDSIVRTTTCLEHRAIVERWVVNYISQNAHFTVEQATVIALELTSRLSPEDFDNPAVLRALAELDVRTELDWVMRGAYPLAGTSPIMIPSGGDGTIPVYPASDVTPPMTVESSPTLVGSMHPPLDVDIDPAVAEISAVLVDDALVYFSQLPQSGIHLQKDEQPDPDVLVRMALERPAGNSSAPARCVVKVNAEAGVDLTATVLKALAQVVYIGLLEHVENVSECEKAIHPMELGLIAHIVGTRLGLTVQSDEMHDDHWMDDFFYGIPDVPVDHLVNWKLVGLAAVALEDSLCGFARF